MSRVPYSESRIPYSESEQEFISFRRKIIVFSSRVEGSLFLSYNMRLILLQKN